MRLSIVLMLCAAAACFAQRQQANAADNIGSEICGACHAPQAQQYGKTIHAKAGPKKGPVIAECESCHGAGKKHAEAMASASTDAEKVAAKKLIFGFHGKPAENSSTCLQCHSSSQDQRVASRSEHKLMGVSCDQCHSAHLVTQGKKETLNAQANFFQKPALAASVGEESRWLNEHLLRKGQPELCFSCHKTIQAQFALPTHHRVPEGLMKCTDCHEAHGTLNRPQLKKVNFEGCVGCHTEKRGPFVYEHPAARVEGCTACHSPHGTVERNLLLRRESRFLCLQCHVDPAATNVPHSRLSYATRGDCERCHAVIHGSNVSPFFLQ